MDSLLKPGETLGDVVPKPAQDPDQLLLREGETLGPEMPSGVISAYHPGIWERIWKTVGNSAIGHAVEQATPKVADALNLHPSETVYSPTYEAHKEQLLAPDELVPPDEHGRIANLTRGVLQGAGGLTSGQSMATIAAAAATGGLLSPAIPAIGRLISLGFTVQAANDLVHEAPNLLNAQDDEEFWQGMGRMGFNIVMLKQMAEHAAGKDSFTTSRLRKVGPYADLAYGDGVGFIEPDAATLARADKTSLGPGLVSRAAGAVTGAAGNLYDRVTGAAADASKKAARKAGEMSVDVLTNFAGGVKDAVNAKISDALRSAMENFRPDETPEQSAQTLRELRAQVSEALKDTGLPEEVIRDINDRVIDEYFIEKHSVSGGMGSQEDYDAFLGRLTNEQKAADKTANQQQADMLTKYAQERAGEPPLTPEGAVEPPPEHYQTLRDLGYTDSQVRKMAPEERAAKAEAAEPVDLLGRARNLAREIVNAIEPPEGMSRDTYMKMQAAKGFYKGATIGGLAGWPFAKSLEGMVAGGVGGAAYGVGSPLAKATIDVLTRDYGMKPPEAVAAVGRFYNDVVSTKVGSAIDTVLSKHAEVAERMARAGYTTGVYLGSAVRHTANFASEQIGKAFNAAFNAAKSAKDAAGVSDTVQGLRAQVRDILGKAKLPTEAINDIVDRLTDEWYSRFHSAEDAPGPGAAGPVNPTWLPDALYNAFNNAKDTVFGTPTGTTAVAEAAQLPGVGPEVAAAATKGQMIGGGTLSFENWLRKQAPAGKWLNEHYDAQGRAMAESVAQKIVDMITGQHMDSAEAGQFLQDALLKAGSEAQEGLLNVLHQETRGIFRDMEAESRMPRGESNDARISYNPTQLNSLLSMIEQYDRSLYEASGVKNLHDRLMLQNAEGDFGGRTTFEANSRQLLGPLIRLREELVTAWRRGSLDQVQMRDVTTRLDKFMGDALKGIDPQAAESFATAAERARNFTELTYSEVYRSAMKVDADLVFDKMIDSTTKGEFLQILQAVGDQGLDTIRQGLAQRILERSFSQDGVLRIDDLKALTDKNKAKLGEQYANLNTLHKGLAEMEKSWRLSEAGMNAGRSLLGSNTAKLVFGLGGALLGHGSLTGILSALGVEMGMEAVAGFTAKVTARYLMKPGALTELNAFMRAYANMSQRVPSTTLDSFADRIAKDVRKAADKAADWTGRKMEQRAQRQAARPRVSPAK